ncbi:hypothetical protein C8D87_105288 [Lentzea atacamensis]|uniref:Activator of Hsp90 ATPase homolog 1-like protein n=1 Tax=Lentzea atacamensis TaxID=531938 RepID=A0ABX9E628_9PSEU|nr:hypothetical protein [Lentzea atacamensis]RAS64795.1 hypothetical protein C8D87_105288 [Lentzea atacamensis]
MPVQVPAGRNAVRSLVASDCRFLLSKTDPARTTASTVLTANGDDFVVTVSSDDCTAELTLRWGKHLLEELGGEPTVMCRRAQEWADELAQGRIP